jgi:hypothetical protein
MEDSKIQIELSAEEIALISDVIWGATTNRKVHLSDIEIRNLQDIIKEMDRNIYRED